MKTKLLLLFFCLAAFVACKKDDVTPINPGPERPTPAVIINIDDITTSSFTCTFNKCDSCLTYDIYAAEPGATEAFIGMFVASLEDAVSQWGIHVSSDTTYTWKDMTPDEDYVIYVLAHCEHGNILITDTIHTAILGGHGESVITLSVSNIGTNHVTTTAVPNDQTAMFKDLIITKEYFDAIGRDSVISLVKEDYYTHYNTDTWTWSDLQPNTDFYFVAIGQNADKQWGEFSLLPFSTL